eukprot:Amastigsp_a842159_22.p3 type:complete len:129 gc:universal Amastigsp_a842159_22:1105-719(-)
MARALRRRASFRCRPCSATVTEHPRTAMSVGPIWTRPCSRARRTLRRRRRSGTQSQPRGPTDSTGSCQSPGPRSTQATATPGSSRSSASSRSWRTERRSGPRMLATASFLQTHSSRLRLCSSATCRRV